MRSIQPGAPTGKQAVLAVLLCASMQAQLPVYQNFEARQSRPICLSPDQNLLFAVNTPDSKLSVFDVSNPSNPAPILIHEIPVGLEPVSANALSNDEVWVVNQVSDSISVVSVSQRLAIATLRCPDEPADVVFAEGRAFVACSGTNQIALFDSATRQDQGRISLAGIAPRSLAVSNDGTRVFASFALSGNRSTLLPANLAPPQPAPTNPLLPSPPQVGLIVDADDIRLNPAPVMPDNDVAEINAATAVVDRYFSGVGTVNFTVSVRPGAPELWVSNTDARNLIRFEPNLKGHAVDNRMTKISLGATPGVVPIDLNPDIDHSILPNPAAKAIALAQPMGQVFEPDGSHLWIASYGTDRVARVQASDGAVVARVSVHPDGSGTANPRTKRGPRGLAYQTSTGRLYVLNRISNSVSVVDTLGQSVVAETPAGSVDPTPSSIREGRGFLYDALLSGNGTQSCASCHIDGDRDELAWDLGDPGGNLDTVTQPNPLGGPDITFTLHPMKGPMTTQTLKGIDGTEPLHWRGDRPDFESFNIAFSGLLGGSSLSEEDMIAFRDFILTMTYEPNPNQNLDRSMPPSFPPGDPEAGDPNAGLNTYVTETYVPGLTCNTCHSLPTGTNNLLINAVALQESQDFKVPQLRNIYQKRFFNRDPATTSLSGFGLTHDGLDPDLVTFLSRPVFGTFADDTVRKRNLSAFLHCLDTGTAPAVGFGKTFSSSSGGTGDADWTTLEERAAAGDIDLVVQGSVQGEERGFIYRPSTDDYISDESGHGPYSRLTLESWIGAGQASLTVTGAPPGSGFRLALDRDLDSILNRDEMMPELEISLNPGSVPVLRWTDQEPFMVLEFRDDLSPDGNPWQTATGSRILSAPWVQISDPTDEPRRFYRLRRP